MQTSIKFLEAMQQRYGTANWQVYKPWRQPLYDYCWYPTTAALTLPIQFFSVPRGNADPNAPTTALGRKTEEDTNLETSMQMASNILWISAIRCHVRIMPKARQNATVAALASYIYRSAVGGQDELAKLFNFGYLSIKFNQKLFVEIERPFVTAPAAFGVNMRQFASGGDGAGSPAAINACWQQSNPDIGSLWDCEPGIWIDPGQQIDAQFSFPDADAPNFATVVGGQPWYIQVGLWLDGYQIRPVQ